MDCKKTPDLDISQTNLLKDINELVLSSIENCALNKVEGYKIMRILRHRKVTLDNRESLRDIALKSGWIGLVGVIDKNTQSKKIDFLINDYQNNLLSENMLKFFPLIDLSLSSNFSGLATCKCDEYTFQGTFSNGKKQGKGTIIKNIGEIYEGSFKNDLYDGYGTIKNLDGTKISGKFKDGTIETGKKYDSKGIILGIYQEGKFILS